MKLRDSFAGNERFEGDRVLRWRTIPANAKIVSAKATVTPIDGGLGIPFAEVLNFNSMGEFGATRTLGSLALPTPTAWVEVDFRARRTLASVAGTFNGATLQVDVGGGTYVEINRAGAFKTPSDPTDFSLTSSGGALSLPALSVAKLKLTHTSTTSPDLRTVVVRSAPSNVSLRLEPLSPFFTHPGEMTQAETSADFAAVLQAALVDARIENGFYDLRLTLHSDTIARLQVDLEIDFLVEKNPLPDGLAEVVLPFDFSTLAQSSAATLNVAVPPNSRVVPEQTTARVRGNFAESRIAYGPTGTARPVAAVEVSPALSQAQIIAVDDKDVPVTAIDLFLESKTPSSQLRVDIRNDLDGKPGDDSLLTTPVELSISAQTGKVARWESVPLAAERLLSKSRRYWLVVQSIQGTVAWYVDKPQTATASASSAASPATRPVDPATSKLFSVQTTRDGGLSWRDAIAMPGTLAESATSAAGPFVAFFRLRTQPKTFKVPIELQAGRDTSEVRIKLDRFAPLGRVDFALDTELAQGINESLDKTPATTSTDDEHLQNGDFEEWQSVGEGIRLETEIHPIAAPISAVAFSPDGRLAYVLDQIVKHRLLVIDVDCNRELKERAISLAPSPSNPRRFVVSPDGTRAYVLDTQGQLQVVNLVTHQTIGTPFALKGDAANEGTINDLALSPDGRLLYLAGLDRPNNQIHIINTAKLEQQLTTGLAVSDVMLVVPVDGTDQTDSPRALAVSPDGTILYMVVDANMDPGKVLAVDTRTVTLRSDISITIGHTVQQNNTQRTAIAVSPDGRRAVVTNGADNQISLINTANGQETKIGVGTLPVDVAISPDGAQAYVLNQTDSTISPVDLRDQVKGDDFRAVPATATPPRVPVALALSPAGDQIYVAARVFSTETSAVSVLPFGKRSPREWHLTSGEATPFCLDDPFHLVSILGSQLEQTGLSQVMSVAESTVYEFSFWGIARESETDATPAVAEVFWLGDDCGAAGSPLSIPIQLMAAPPTAVAGASRAELIFGPGGGGSASLLQLHRARATSPAGAKQAEVRFTIPTDGLAAIDQVSLITTSESALNADFKQQEGGQLTGWKISPANAPGFRALATADGIQLLNAGASTVELIQAVDAKGGEPFTLGVEGRTTVAAATNPRVDVRWIKSDGAATGLPTVVEIDTGSSSFVAASGTAPDDAVQAEIHLTVPAGSTLEVERASLRFAAPTIVPISFIAEAPGELTVSDVRVAFEEVESTGPPRDVTLCVATPPGQDPGKDHCPCHVCATEDSGEHEAAESMAQPVVVVPQLSSPGALSLMTRPHALRLTDVSGIAEKRARQLAEIGIDSVEKLASSTPETVAGIKFITPKMAARIIADAKSLIL